MSSGRTRIAALLLGLTLSACAHREPPVVAIAVPPPPPIAAPMPQGGRPGMVIPAQLPDGTYPTPSLALSREGATWHLRAALNVAVLACRGANEATMTAQYNQLLTSQRTPLAAAEHALANEFAASTPAGRAAYDSAMTRLYNFYAQDMARPGFCEAARTILTQVALVPAAELPAFAEAHLADLDRPFTDFYAAYDRWRSGAAALPVTTIAAQAVSSPSAPQPAPTPRVPVSTAAPHLTIDVAALN